MGPGRPLVLVVFVRPPDRPSEHRFRPPVRGRNATRTGGRNRCQSLMTPCVTRNDENTMMPEWCPLYWSSSGAATGYARPFGVGGVVGTGTVYFRSSLISVVGDGARGELIGPASPQVLRPGHWFTEEAAWYLEELGNLWNASFDCNPRRPPRPGLAGRQYGPARQVGGRTRHHFHSGAARFGRIDRSSREVTSWLDVFCTPVTLDS
jgi:hypothetical protein